MFLLPCAFTRSVSLPHDAMRWSAISKSGISYFLKLLRIVFAVTVAEKVQNMKHVQKCARFKI